MHRTLLLSFISTGILSSVFFTAPIAFAADCPPGTRPATASDIAAMTTAGIPNAVVGMCWNASDPSVGQAASDAKQWLMQHTKLDKTRIMCLNAQFAEKLKSFMEKVPGGVPKITSAYRTFNEQIQAMNSGASRVSNACNGYHLYGLAADFNSNSSQQTEWMRANATQFGLRPIGAWDPNHFQDATGISGQCGTCAASGSDGVGGAAGGQPQQSFLQRAMGAVQNFITPPQPIQCPAGTVLMNGQCMPQQSAITPSPYDYMQPASPTSSSTSQNINSNTTTGTSTSVSDLINAIANPTSTPEKTTTSTPVKLNPNLHNTITLQGANTGDNDTVATARIPIQNVQQTFTSPDLQQNSVPAYATGPASTFTILENLKQTLLMILRLLQPFGGKTPHTVAPPTLATTAYLR